MFFENNKRQQGETKKKKRTQFSLNEQQKRK